MSRLPQCLTGHEARAVFLDRDGTITQDVGYPHRIKDLVFLPGAIQALQSLKRVDFHLIVATNQSGVARGLFGEDDVDSFHAEMVRQLRERGVSLSAIYACPFHPSDGANGYRRESPWRKPNSGMLLQAARDFHLDPNGSFMIGDKPSDVAAGRAAGCRTVLLDGPHSIGVELELSETPDWRAVDLASAARIVLEHCRDAQSAARGAG